MTKLIAPQALDECQLCLGAKGGVPGNENVVRGLVMCDYCHALLAPAFAEERRAATVPSDGEIYAAASFLSPQYRRGYLEGLTASQTSKSGYAQAFYQLAELMRLPASVRSPRQVWESEMLPRLRELLRESGR